MGVAPVHLSCLPLFISLFCSDPLLAPQNSPCKSCNCVADNECICLLGKGSFSHCVQASVLSRIWEGTLPTPSTERRGGGAEEGAQMIDSVTGVAQRLEDSTSPPRRVHRAPSAVLGARKADGGWSGGGCSPTTARPCRSPSNPTTTRVQPRGNIRLVRVKQGGVGLGDVAPNAEAHSDRARGTRTSPCTRTRAPWRYDGGSHDGGGGARGA